MVGLSLSACVVDICEGRVKVEDVEIIKAMTTAVTESDWDKLLDMYCATYWSEYPDKARAVVAELRASSRIDQVRLHGGWHSIVGGHWEA